MIIRPRDHPTLCRAVLKGLLGVSLLAAVSWASDQPTTLWVAFNRTVYFTTTDGARVAIEPAAYRLAQEGEQVFRLTSDDGGRSYAIGAARFTHDTRVSAPLALTIPEGEDAVRLVLLQPGEGSEAIGSLSEVQTRSASVPAISAARLAAAFQSQQQYPAAIRADALAPGAPPNPTLISPPDNFNMPIPQVYFRWERGAGSPSATVFRICVREPTQTCTQPEAAFYSVPENPAIGVYRFDPPGGLPMRFLGKNFQWFIMACGPNPQQLGQESCSSSPARRLTWEFPQPALYAESFGAAGAPAAISFPWNYPATGIIDHFQFCMTPPGLLCGTSAYRSPTSEPYNQTRTPSVERAVGASARSQSFPQFMLRDFEGMTVQWTVGACIADGRCMWAPHREFTFPRTPGSFRWINDAIRQTSKCTNCHGMDSHNAKYQLHVSAGRFPANTNPTNGGICQSCHTQATGFIDGWHAPPRHRDFTNLDTLGTCELFSQGTTYGPSPLLHLRESHNILWAVDRIPGLGRARWNALLDAWDAEGLRCPGKINVGQLLSPWAIWRDRNNSR